MSSAAGFDIGTPEDPVLPRSGYLISVSSPSRS